MKSYHLWRGVCAGAAMLVGVLCAQSAWAESYVLGWGLNGNQQADPTPEDVLAGASAIAGGARHSLAIKEGNVYAWGLNDLGQTNVPLAARSGDASLIAAGGNFSLAVATNDGVVAWGLPRVANYVPDSVRAGVTAIAAGASHALAVTSNGTVVAWGSNAVHQCDVPSDLVNVVRVAAGDTFSMALRADGAVVAWGSNEDGESTPPPEASSGVTAIAAGAYHALALKNGGVLEWGHTTNFYTVPTDARQGVIAIAAGYEFSMALKEDGTVVVWGDNSEAQQSIPPASLAGVSAIAAGDGHCLMISAGLPPRYLEANTPIGNAEAPYNGYISVTGAPSVVYSGGGNWPDWLTLDSTTGRLTGTPPASGTNHISIVATNLYGTWSENYSIIVAGRIIHPPTFVTTSPLNNGEVGLPFEQQFEATDATAFFVTQTNLYSLPAGLSLSESGLLSGTPAAEYAAFFLVCASNVAGITTNTFNMTVTAASAAPVITTLSPLDSARLGESYSAQIESDRVATFRLTEGALPAGLDLAANGALSGTPTDDGLFAFTVEAANTHAVSVSNFTMEVYSLPEFVTESPLPVASKGTPYTMALLANGYPVPTFRLASGTLPAGLSIATDGTLSGTPTGDGNFTFSVAISNQVGSATRAFSLTVNNFIAPVFTAITPVADGIRLEWQNLNPVGVEVWQTIDLRSPNLWTNLGVQTSPWTNLAPPANAAYRLRLSN